MKKGFIFSMDAFLAVILFVLVVFLIYTFSISLSGLNQQYFFSDDVLTALDKNKISELNLANYPNIDQLVKGGKIRDLDVTLVEQIVTFQLENDETSARLITEDIINKIKSQDIETAVYIASPQPLYGQDPINIDNILARTKLAVGKK